MGYKMNSMNFLLDQATIINIQRKDCISMVFVITLDDSKKLYD